MFYTSELLRAILRDLDRAELKLESASAANIAAEKALDAIADRASTMVEVINVREEIGALNSLAREAIEMTLTRRSLLILARD